MNLVNIDSNIKSVVIYNAELCGPWVVQLVWQANFFPFIENYTLLFALLCPPVWKPEAVGQAPADISFQIENDDFNLE